MVSRVVPGMSLTMARSAADDGHGDAFFQRVAHLERADQAADLVGKRRNGVLQTVTVGKFEVFVAEIQFQFEQSGKIDKFLPQRLQFACISASHLADCQRVRHLRTRIDKVSDGFGL